jgi:HEAT repeat protein
MSGKRSVLGATSATAGVFIAIAIAVWLGWPVWLELRNRGWIPGVPPQPTRVEDEKAPEEPLDLPSAADVPRLVATFSAGDEDARRQALLQLSSIGPAAADALPMIREQMQDDYPGIRFAAVLALGRICRDPDVLIPLLAGMLDDESSPVAKAAARKLEEIGPRATEAVMNVLRGDSRRRARAVLMLRRFMRPDNFAELSEIIRGLRNDPDPGVRAEALMFDLETGRTDAPTIKALLEIDYTSPAVYPPPNPDPRGTGSDRNTCNMALRAVARLGPDAGEFIAELIALFKKQAALDSEFSSERAPRRDGRPVWWAQFTPRMRLILEAFSGLKTAARPAIPHLTARLEGLEPPHSLNLIRILFDIGADPEALTPALTEMLKADDPRARRAAAALLARVNPPEARRQVALLVATLAEADLSKVQAVVPLLEGFGPEAREAVPRLMELLSYEGGKYRYVVTEALVAIGADSAPAVPAIVSSLEQTQREGKILYYGDVRLETLAKIGPAASGALPLLLELINDTRLAPPSDTGFSSELKFRELVMSALVRIAPDSREVLAAIRSQLKSEIPELRQAAVYELPRAATGSTSPLPEIIAVLENDPAASVRARAAQIIAEMSGDRRAAIAPLIAALDDAHSAVRASAATALGSMGVAAQQALPKLREMWIHAFCGISGTSTPGAPRTPEGVPVAQPARDMPDVDIVTMAQILLHAIKDIDPGSPVTP